MPRVLSYALDVLLLGALVLVGAVGTAALTRPAHAAVRPACGTCAVLKAGR